MFKTEFFAEWHRLNPRYVQPDDGLGQTLAHACHESLHSYFAPLFMVLWLLKRVTQKLVSRAPN